MACSRERSYEEQPVKVPVPGRRPYVPDILFHFRLLPNDTPIRRSVLGEAKPNKYLFEKRQKLRPVFKAARLFAADNGWDFKIFTERQIKTPMLKNARFLIPFLKRKPNVQLTEVLLDALANSGVVMVRSLISAMQPGTEHQPDFYAEVWRLA